MCGSFSLLTPHSPTYLPQASGLSEEMCNEWHDTNPRQKTMLLARIKSCLQAVYGDRLRGVVLYGSEARGEATPDSDVDILVLLTGPVALAAGAAHDHRDSLPSATGNGSYP